MGKTIFAIKVKERNNPPDGRRPVIRAVDVILDIVKVIRILGQNLPIRVHGLWHHTTWKDTQGRGHQRRRLKAKQVQHAVGQALRRRWFGAKGLNSQGWRWKEWCVVWAWKEWALVVGVCLVVGEGVGERLDGAGRRTVVRSEPG